jgi:hypothetical protein
MNFSYHHHHHHHHHYCFLYTEKYGNKLNEIPAQLSHCTDKSDAYYSVLKGFKYLFIIAKCIEYKQ